MEDWWVRVWFAGRVLGGDGLFGGGNILEEQVVVVVVVVGLGDTVVDVGVNAVRTIETVVVV